MRKWIFVGAVFLFLLLVAPTNQGQDILFDFTKLYDCVSVGNANNFMFP